MKARDQSIYDRKFAGSAVSLILLVWLILQAGTLGAEPNTGKSSARSPKCQAEYEQCAKNCDKTQIDIDNQIKQCKDKCARDTDTYCSRTVTSGGGNAVTPPKANLGNVQVQGTTGTTGSTGAPASGGAARAVGGGGGFGGCRQVSVDRWECLIDGKVILCPWPSKTVGECSGSKPPSPGAISGGGKVANPSTGAVQSQRK